MGLIRLFSEFSYCGKVLGDSQVSAELVKLHLAVPLDEFSLGLMNFLKALGLKCSKHGLLALGATTSETTYSDARLVPALTPWLIWDRRSY